MTARLSLLLGASLAISASACSGGGGGGGDAEVEIFPPAATVVPGSLTNASVELSALVDGEPGDVQWVVVGGGYVTVTSGPTTTYVSPIEGIATEPIEVSVFAFADGGEAEAAITLHDSAGLLNVTYTNYDASTFDIGPLIVNIVDDATGAVFDAIDGSRTGYTVQAGSYHASDDGIPQQILWGEVGVVGTYLLAPAEPTVVPDDGEATIDVRWIDGGTGMLWAASAGTASLVGFTGPSLVPNVPAETRIVRAGDDRRYADVVDTIEGLLWTADFQEQSIVGFNAAALGTGGQMSGNATVINSTAMVGTTSSLPSPTSVAWDPGTGDLWYANLTGTFGRFDATQLGDDPGQQSATAPEAFFLNLAGRSNVYAIAVDAAGNVWIGSEDTIQRYDAGDVSASGAPLPAAVYTGPWTGARALEFDVSGNLWIGDASAHVYRLDAGQLGATGIAVVVPDLDVSGSLIAGPVEALELDDAGNVYFTNADSVQRIDAANASGTGTLDASFSYVSIPVNGATGLAFRRSPALP